MTGILYDSPFHDRHERLQKIFADEVFRRPDGLPLPRRASNAYRMLRQAADQIGRTRDVVRDPNLLFAFYDWAGTALHLTAKLYVLEYLTARAGSYLAKDYISRGLFGRLDAEYAVTCDQLAHHLPLLVDALAIDESILDAPLNLARRPRRLGTACSPAARRLNCRALRTTKRGRERGESPQHDEQFRPAAKKRKQAPGRESALRDSAEARGASHRDELG